MYEREEKWEKRKEGSHKNRERNTERERKKLEQNR